MKLYFRSSLAASPWSSWFILLIMSAIAEWAVMLILPWILPNQASRLWESIIDTALLSILLSPLLWWFVVRPLQESIRFRERYLAQMLTRVEDERRRIAQELHDGVGQSLTLLVSGLKSLKSATGAAEMGERSADLQKLGQQSLKEIRQIMLGLRPTLLDDLGLGPALQRLAEEAMRKYPLDIQVHCELESGEHVPPSLEIAVFRIVQEAMSNVIKHAGARQMVIHLQKAAHQLMLEISDDGCGMDTGRIQRMQKPDGHLGLIGMGERVALLGGDLRFQSKPGQGTRIVAHIPLGVQPG